MAAEGDGEILSVEVDIRSHFSPFNFPPLPEVIRAIDDQLPTDRLKVVKQLRGSLLGLYKITSSNYELYVNKTVKIRDKVLPITPRRKQPRVLRERPGILVTIYDAFDGTAQEIPGAAFNEHFGTYESVKFIRQTSPQFHKGTRILNGNRFLVLDFDPTTTDLGENIQIGGFHFRINYQGQHRLCYLCQQRHGNDCPEKTKFQELVAQREGRLTHKFYADSTLRKVNQLAMTANVTCTSGAGIGQIANLILQDPDKTENVFIVAGGNDIRQSLDEHQYQHIVDAAAKKLHHLSATRNITLVLPVTPRETLDDEVKHTVMKETMSKLKSITVVDLPQGVVDHEGIHPTKDGTTALLGLIQKAAEVDLVIDQDYLTLDRNYSQVSSYYKVGCRACDNTAYTTCLCTTCEETCKTTDVTRLFQIAKEIYERDNPPLESDVDMKDIMKRSLTSFATSTEAVTDIVNGDEAKRQRIGSDA